MYRLGCCVPSASFAPQIKGAYEVTLDTITENSRFTLDCGFDYVELTVGVIMSLSDEELVTLRERDLKIESANSFIPGKFSIIEGGEELEAYAAEAIRKSALAGIKVIVFGSGAARRMPDGATEEEKLASVKGFLTHCNEYAKKYGVTIVIEPLQSGECNYINKVTEGASIARELGLSNIRSLADSFHMGLEKEPFSVLSQVSDVLAHIHVAENVTRTYPGKENDEAFLPEMARVLKTTDYDGRISIECNFTDFKAEAPLAYEYLNKIFN